MTVNSEHNRASYADATFEARLQRAEGVYNSRPPERLHMLRSACRIEQTQHKEPTMIERMFAGRGFAARLAIATLLLAAVAVTATLMPRGVSITTAGPRVDFNRAIASEGYILSYELPKDNASAQAKLERIASEFADAKDGAPAEVSVFPGGTTATDETQRVAVSVYGDEEQAAELERRITEQAGLSAARSRGVWFGDSERSPVELQSRLHFTFKNASTVFVFPHGTSAGEMESAIAGWAAQQEPGNVYHVTVELAKDGTLAGMSMTWDTRE